MNNRKEFDKFEDAIEFQGSLHDANIPSILHDEPLNGVLWIEW